MQGSAIPLLIVFIVVLAIGAEEIGFVILKPTQEVLHNVHFATIIQLEVALWVSAGSQVPPQLVVCTAEVLPEFDYGGGKKTCIGATNFYMNGLRTGTNLINVTVESGTVDSDDRMALASQILLIDAVDIEVQRSDAKWSQLARGLPMIAPAVKPLDYFYYSNPGNAAPTASDFAVIAAVDRSYTTAGSLSGGDVSTVLSTDPTMEGIPPVQRRVRVALWARIAPQFVPSDRFLDWICDHAFLAAQGLDVVVIAPATENAVPTICGAPVMYFACLRELEVTNYGLDDGPALLAEPTLLPLVQYLSQHVDALLVINTYGDAQTSLLLEVSHQLALLHRQGGNEVQGLGNLHDWHAPFTIMDMPNIGVRKEWYYHIDGFIAPSRAVGLHLETTSHWKPVAVIYPPVRDLIIQASLCRDAYFAGSSAGVSFHRDRAGERNTAAAAPIVAATPADSSAASSATHPAAAEVLLLDPQHFNVLFVGRLARVKSPGLLIKALGYLLATAEREWEETLDAVGSTEVTVEQRYRRELAAIILREQSAAKDEAGVPRDTLVLLLEKLRATVRVTYIGGGTAALTEALRGLAGALNVSAQVALMGAQAPERVVQYMQQAHVLVNPIVIGETFGLVHIEAAAQGLPVIAFDVRANAESVVFFGDGSGRLGDSSGAVAGDTGANGRSDGVQSALLPYREGAVVQDLALALLTAFLQHQHHRQGLGGDQPASSLPAQAESGTGRTGVQRDGGGGIGARAAVCYAVVPMFAHWNSRQHSRALVDAVRLFLLGTNSH